MGERTSYAPRRLWDGEPGFDERLVSYEEGPLFARRCEQCGLFVRAPAVVHLDGFGRLRREPHTTCRRCGPTRMVHVGWDGDA